MAWPSRRRCTSRSTVPSRSRAMRVTRAAISAYSGRWNTDASRILATPGAAMPSIRSAAPLMVVTRPAGSSETTPVATAPSTVSV